MSELGKILRELRGKESLRDAAKRTGVSHTYLSIIEKGYDLRSGSPVNPSPDTLKTLADAYNYPYEELMRAAGYIKEETETIKLLDELIANLIASKYDTDLVNYLTLEEKLEILIKLTESSGNMSVEKLESGKREIRLGSNTVEITDPDSIDQLDLSYDGMQLTRDEKLEFLAIAKGIFSARQALRENN